ncbi:histone-lysine N-methyltransferase, H3 lysine-79 specific-like [Benincasa hispida]|uniref:histone-lysine N-methyltransferase, H3 lysine-79 specific-like n=1 Tax=Benincasa hispida TaxID=102211 RepID=UPI0018FF3332|nr:histone-lysine N-methyltransferase, H3 lysine-79 specific-like [Benincasa hispida]
MEKEGGLPEAGVVNQPLPSEEEMEEALRRSALAVSDPKETVQVESYEGPIKVSLEEAVVEKQPEMAEEKKKKIKEKRAEGEEEAHPNKKKERRMSEKRERRREEKCLKKEKERRKRAESPKIDRKSTSTRVHKWESAQLQESAQPEEEITQVKTIVADDGEDSDTTPLLRHRKENARQGSTIDPKERRRREEEEKQEKMLRAQRIIAEGS